MLTLTCPSYWVDVFNTALYLINPLPARTLQFSTPYAKLFNRPPKYDFLRIFDCACFPYLRPYNTYKLQFRSKKCVFLGYSLNHQGYRCFDISTGRVYLSRHMVFDEYSFPFQDISYTQSSLNIHLDPFTLLLGSDPVPFTQIPTPPPTHNSPDQHT